MGTGPLAHPFRLAANGEVLTRIAGSDDDVNDRISLIIDTIQDERPLYPSFGIPDPVFVGISPGDIQACLREYGPENIEILDFDGEPVTAEQTNYHIQWTREEPEDSEDEDEDEDEFDGQDDEDFEDEDED